MGQLKPLVMPQPAPWELRRDQFIDFDDYVKFFVLDCREKAYKGKSFPYAVGSWRHRKTNDTIQQFGVVRSDIRGLLDANMDRTWSKGGWTWGHYYGAHKERIDKLVELCKAGHLMAPVEVRYFWDDPCHYYVIPSEEDMDRAAASALAKVPLHVWIHYESFERAAPLTRESAVRKAMRDGTKLPKEVIREYQDRDWARETIVQSLSDPPTPPERRDPAGANAWRQERPMGS